MTRHENTLLLMCLAHHDELLVEAISKVGTHPLFDSLSDPCSLFIWSVMRDCRDNMDTFPTKPLVEMEVKARLDGMLGFDAPFKRDVLDTLTNIYAVGEGRTSVQIGRNYLQGALQEAVTLDWVEKIQRLGTLEEMRAYVTGVASDIANITSTSDAIEKPLKTPDKFLVRKIRDTFGIRVLDLITGGGIAPGEMLGLLGPTGGGKTVFAIGMLCERAMRKQHVLLASYEEKTEGDIMERICSYITSEDVSLFRDKNFGDIDPVLQGKVLEKRAEYSDYLTVLNLATGARGGGGADELINNIDRQIESGEKPTLVIIDWLGSMVQRYLAESGVASSDYRHIGHRFVDRIRTHAMEKGYAVVVNHQLSTTAARASSSAKPQATDAYEFKAFSYFMDGCVCLGTLDMDSKVGWLVMDKFRRGGASDMMIRLDGAHVRFEPAMGYVTDHRGKFMEADAAPPDVDDELARKDNGVSRVYSQAFPT